MNARPAPALALEAGHEGALVLAMQQGEAGACAELLRHYHRVLRRLCLALTHDHARAEELHHEVARKFWRNRSQLQVGLPLLPHLVRLVRAIAQARRQEGGEPSPLRPNGAEWESGALGAHDVGYEQRLLAALATLPMEDRTLLALRLFERLPYASVGAISGLSVATAMQRIALARARLEETMAPRSRAA